MSAPLEVNYIPNWYARLTALIYQQFAATTTWPQWCALLAQQAQDIENAVQSLFSAFDIQNSQGAQLDVIGRVVGLPRGGVNDATYRIYLAAQVLANKSEGTPEQIYAIMEALFGAPLQMVLTTSPIKSFVLSLYTTITYVQVAAALQFLAEAREAGVYAILEFNEVSDPLLLRFDVATPGFDVGVFGGATQA